MDTRSLAQPAHPSTSSDLEHVSGIAARVLRGQALYAEHADDIRYESGIWFIPSQSEGTSIYEVTLGRHESCECADHGQRGSACKHIIAATVARAKSAPCSMCGTRHKRRDLTEVSGDHLSCFEGDLLCPECASDHGVL